MNPTTAGEEDPNKICRECGTFRFPDIDACVYCHSIWPDRVEKVKAEQPHPWPGEMVRVDDPRQLQLQAAAMQQFNGSMYRTDLMMSTQYPWWNYGRTSRG